MKNKHAASFSVKTYASGTQITQSSILILSKGNNAGKILDKPCPNCLLITTHNPDDFPRLHLSIKRLFLTGAFERILVGSVIPFLRVSEVRALIQEDLQHQTCHSKVLKMNHRLIEVNKLRENLKRQIELLNQLERSILSR